MAQGKRDGEIALKLATGVVVVLLLWECLYLSKTMGVSSMAVHVAGVSRLLWVGIFILALEPQLTKAGRCVAAMLQALLVVFVVFRMYGAVRYGGASQSLSGVGELAADAVLILAALVAIILGVREMRGNR